MKIITTSNSLTDTFITLLNKYKYISFSTAWASSGHKAFDALLKNSKKIKSSTIGLHFYQTDPKVLKVFKGNNDVRFILQTNGVFHPKIYVFYNNDREWSILMGSANFTKGAFKGDNIENIIQIDSEHSSVSIYNEFKSFVENNFNLECAKKVDETYINNYENQFIIRNRSVHKLLNTYKSRNNFLDIKILNYSWDDYLEKMKKEKDDGFNKRVIFLNKIELLFKENSEFKMLDKENIKSIIGLSTQDPYSDWFGHLKTRLQAGFGKRLEEHINIISDAIDSIPLVGKIERGTFLEYINEFYSAFDYKELSAATRLISMKRPDLFFCMNNSNKDGIAEALGIKKSNMTAEFYWDEILERLYDSPWFNSPKPKDSKEKSAWKYRVALIDCIYYRAEKNG